MIETGEDASLTLEASQPIGIGRKRLRQNFDRNVAPETGIAGAVHLAHPAAADPFLHEIHAEPTPSHADTGRLTHRLRDRRWRQVFEPSRCGLIE